MEYWRGMLTMICVVSLVAETGTWAADDSADDPPIAAVQALLKQERLYSGPVDGMLGEGTVAAIRRYQILHGLRATGNLDPTTLRIMLLPPAPPSAEISAADREFLRELSQTPIPTPDAVAERRVALPPADIPAVTPTPSPTPEKKSSRSRVVKHRKVKSQSLISD